MYNVCVLPIIALHVFVLSQDGICRLTNMHGHSKVQSRSIRKVVSHAAKGIILLSSVQKSSVLLMRNTCYFQNVPSSLAKECFI